MTPNDTKDRCPHLRLARTRPSQTEGPGWVDVLAPEDCSICPAGQVLSTYLPGPALQDGPKVPEELEAPETAEPALKAVTTPGSSKTPIPVTGLVTAWIAGYEAVMRDLERATGANAARNTEIFSRVTYLEQSHARRSELEQLAERVGRLEAAEVHAAGKAETLEALAELKAGSKHPYNPGCQCRVCRAEREATVPDCFRCGSPFGTAAFIEEPGVGWRHVDGSPACTVLPVRKRVIVESPFAGGTEHKVYARRAMVDSLGRGEAPLLSHLLYPQVLDDDDPMDRYTGMSAGWAWLPVAELVAVYADLGISDGMRAGISRAEAAGIPVEVRRIKRRFTNVRPVDLDADDFDAT